MRHRITDDTFVVLLYVLSAMMLTGQFFEINIITSISFALSFVVVFVFWILHLKESSTLDILTILIMAASLIGPFMTCNKLSVSYFNNWLMFSSVFLYFSVCMKIKMNGMTAKKLFKITSFVSFVCLFAYIIRRADAFYVTNLGIKYLKFGFYNPNSLALFLLCIVFGEICYFSFYYERKHWLIKICYTAIFTILIGQTLSRTALLALILFLGINITFKRKGRHYIPQSRLFNLTVVIFPLIFAVLYMLIIDKFSQNGIFAFLISEGKGLDSRQRVWEYAFSMFRESPLWGSYGNMVTSSLFSQMHNSHLNVLVSYGIVVFLLVVLFLYIVLSDLCKKSKSARTELAAWAFIICLILGSGEAILFSGGLSFYLLDGQFLLLCNVSKDPELSR